MRLGRAARLSRILSASLLSLAASCVGGATAATADQVPAFGDSAGIHVVSTERLDPRLYSVRVSSGALGRAVDVRVLLPAGYADQPATRYPVLYLFHGTSGRASDWTTLGDAERTTAGLPLIVVMPDAGFDGDGGGYFTDWYNDGAGGPPRWETFHIDQVLPWIDHTLRTVAERRGRAIYGLSQGGFGSMSYAARHPDLFVAAGAYSGAVDTAADPEAIALMTPIVIGTTFGLDGKPPDSIFGPRLTEELNWRAHDEAIRCGYECALAHIDHIKGSVTDAHRLSK